MEWSDVKVGARVQLKIDVSRYPHFTASAGTTGVITLVDRRHDGTIGLIIVKADQHIKGAEDWDNEIQWFDDWVDSFTRDVMLEPKNSMLEPDEAIVERARNAFWKEIADSYPQITTGDLDPGVHSYFDHVTFQAVKMWLYWNLPKEE